MCPRIFFSFVLISLSSFVSLAATSLSLSLSLPLSLSARAFQERDNIIGKIYRRLMEIESRLLPCGLHTVGVPPTAAEAVATLVNIASLDRPEDGIKSLPRIAAESMGREIGEIYTNADNGVLEDVELLQQVRRLRERVVSTHAVAWSFEVIF